jgi:hypothetical protein
MVAAMPERTATATPCSVPGCGLPTTTLKDSPTVTGYCLDHAVELAAWIDTLNAPAHVPVSFDHYRDRWTRGYNLLFGG